MFEVSDFTDSGLEVPTIVLVDSKSAICSSTDLRSGNSGTGRSRRPQTATNPRLIVIRSQIHSCCDHPVEVQ